MTDLVDEILRRVVSVIGPGPHALHEPQLGDLEKKMLARCIDSGYVSSVGPMVTEFEKQLGDFVGSRYVVATVNGTAALHLALLAAGVRIGDEVLVPSLTFAATANAVVYCGATPHFVDVEASTMGMCPEILSDHLDQIIGENENEVINRRTGRRLAAIVPMHTFGHPCDIEAIIRVADKYGVPVVEDAAESLGSRRGEKHTGTFGLAGVVSFNGNKIVTTGGGGAILTDDQNLADKVRHLATTAKRAHPWRYEHDAVGFNYRMPNLNASLGLAQLERLDNAIESKRRLAEFYADAFNSLVGVDFVEEPAGTFSNYWLCAVSIEDADNSQQEELLSRAAKAGLFMRPPWQPQHLAASFADCPRSELSRTDRLATSLVCIPSSAGLK